MFQNWYLSCDTGISVIDDDEFYVEIIDRGTPWEDEVRHLKEWVGRCPENWAWCTPEMEEDDIPF